MTDKLHKNKKIAESFAKTRSKRQTQSCKVITCKIQFNHLNNIQKETLKMMFVEAKWLYNHIINISKNINIFDLDYTDITNVIHFSKNKEEISSTLIYLSSQMKQSVFDGLKQNVKALSKSKTKGNKVGKLKFISEYNSINLKQKDVSYKIISFNKVKIQGIKKPLRVNGLNQLSKEYDLANAKLILKSSGYYIAFTCYVNKNINNDKSNNKEKLGVDFGCQTSLTLSNGDKINFIIEESEHIKRLKRKLSKSKKGSNNRYKLKKKISKLNEKVVNKKNDFVHKLLFELSKYQIIMQDEQLQSWRRSGHGKKIHKGVLGRIKQGLISFNDTVVLHKHVPTSKFCNRCGNKVKLSQWDRVFKCPVCGYEGDRDIHAAENMIWFYENIIGVGRTEYTLTEFKENVKNYFESYSLTMK